MDLIIGKPYVDGNKLISKIVYSDKEYDMFFEVDDDYKKYLCYENSDAFLVSLIPFIIKHEYDVKVEGVISSKLHYQLTNYLLPLLCSEFKKKTLHIECNLTDEQFNSTGVGASISCGVDSFYTLLKHKNQLDSSYNVTHLTFFNAGSNGEYGGDIARKLFNDRLKFIRKFCNANRYKLVTVDTNMNELMMMNHKKTHSFRTLGCVLALQKLFGKYYFASGYHYNGMMIDEDASAHYDTLNVQCLSNQNLTIYSSGLEVSRLDKVKYISNYEETYNWLNVCVRTDENCGECIKCTRTIAELDCIGKLDCYKKVFDLDKFYKNRTKIISEIIRETRYNDGDATYLKEVLAEYKANKIHIPVSAYVLSIIPNKKSIKRVLKKLLPTKVVKKLRKNKKNDGWID